MKYEIALLAMALVALVLVLAPLAARVMPRLIDTTEFQNFARLFPHARLFADGATIESLQNRLLELNEDAESIQAAADAEKRSLSEDEQKKIDSIFAEFHQVEADIARRERIQAQSDKLAQRMGRRTDPNDALAREGQDDPAVAARSAALRAAPQLAPRITSRDLRDPNGGRWGWQSFGHFASGVRAACRNGGFVDPRLVQNAPTSFGQEGVGEDGGFIVPPEFRTAIMEKVQGEEALLSRTDQLTSSSNTIILPKDEVAVWDGSNGVQAYWEGEGDQLTQSKPKFASNTFRLNKLTALVPVTEELLSDASAIDTYLRRKVPEKFTSKVNTALVRGTGAGQPQGILNAACLVSVAKETSQPADTIVAENIVKMHSRLYGPSRTRAVWLINQDIEPQLHTMSLKIKNVAGTENVGGVPIYLPANGLSGSPFGTLMGRPVIPVEDCSTLGDLGDIFFADLSQYMTVMKTGGIRADVSMHLYFDYDMLAYRFIMRLAGAPWWSSAITPKQGSNTRSCFVTLAERA